MACIAALVLAAFGLMVWTGNSALAQSSHPTPLDQAVAIAATPQLVWLDTDIGDDIDDAFALALILRSPELKLVGISTAFGDSELRARLVDRFLSASEAPSGIPVRAGIPTQTDNPMTQAAYALRSPDKAHPDGVAALLTAIRAHPGQLTLIAIGPLENIGAAIDRDPATFRQLRRVVMMGGSISRGYDDSKTGTRRPPDAEWNINRDPKDAQQLMEAGVPIYMMPLDSTQIHFAAAGRNRLFAAGTPLTDQVTLLYHQWAEGSGNLDPTLFDPVAVTAAFRPDLCPATPMHIAVDDKGFTLVVPGTPNVQVCLESDEKAFLTLLQDRLSGAKH